MKKIVPKGPHTVHGIDISHYQPVVNFEQVKAQGNKFVFIKAAEGVKVKDDKFDLHKAEAKAAGLLRGAYLFFHYDQDPIAQAKHFCAVMGTDCELPPVLDVEWADKKAKGTLGKDGAQLALQCLAEIERISGRTPIIYTSGAFFLGEGNPHFFTKYPLWIASYRSDGAVIPEAWSSWKFWQYTDHEAVKGVGKIDADHFNGTLEDLYRFCGMQPPKAAAKVSAQAVDTNGDTVAEESLADEIPEEGISDKGISSSSEVLKGQGAEGDPTGNPEANGEEIFTPVNADGSVKV